ncbi:DUF4058 family protein [Crocosphaera chwakensis]|uniref:DUF4058 domain-containing protein n=1 Tax=Crocosphaera chwakensis CCY0110 TaxID=391612 RepID=A3IPH8_9CHRO|nr:DUF4058 family protein [Crocosphaera chwakensis]EAZ91743.1 hypothetical protein CY0110_26468 [Crocosphaera chwakensis CCY0110]
MPSPFPGMNPYLELPLFWSQVHTHLIVAIADYMNPILRPKYRISMEQRVYTDTNNDDNLELVGIPDNIVFSPSSNSSETSSNIAVAPPKVQPLPITIPQPETVKEWYLQVKNVETQEVVTVIEILSPKNKKVGEGRNKYLKKREQVLMSLTHLIEIDLLRKGEVMPMNVDDRIKSDYRIVISRSYNRPKAELYAFNLAQEIPSIPLVLKPEDEAPLIPLQELLHSIYEKGSYDLAINYQKQTLDNLSENEQTWINNLLQEQDLI